MIRLGSEKIMDKNGIVLTKVQWYSHVYVNMAGRRASFQYIDKIATQTR